jgi:pre-mRNA-splicing factor SYF1
LGTIESAKAAYDKVLELKIANAQIIVNYAQFLEENKYFEESFKVYERGVELFTFPVSFEVWNIYLSKFTKRYVSTRICARKMQYSSQCFLRILGWHKTGAHPRSV